MPFTKGRHWSRNKILKEMRLNDIRHQNLKYTFSWAFYWSFNENRSCHPVRFWLNGSGPISDFLFNKEPSRRLDVMRQNFSWHFHITVLLFSWVFTDMEAILFYSRQKFHLLEHVLQLKFAVSLSPAVRIRQGKLIILKFQLGYMAEYFTISTVVWIFVSQAAGVPVFLTYAKWPVKPFFFCSFG